MIIIYTIKLKTGQIVQLTIDPNDTRNNIDRL